MMQNKFVDIRVVASIEINVGNRETVGHNRICNQSDLGNTENSILIKLKIIHFSCCLSQ